MSKCTSHDHPTSKATSWEQFKKFKADVGEDVWEDSESEEDWVCEVPEEMDVEDTESEWSASEEQRKWQQEAQAEQKMERRLERKRQQEEH